MWSPGRKHSPSKDVVSKPTRSLKFAEEPIPVVWTPRSAGSSPVCERKEFRPVNFESPVLPRKNRTESEVRIVCVSVCLVALDGFLKNKSRLLLEFFDWVVGFRVMVV